MTENNYLMSFGVKKYETTFRKTTGNFYWQLLGQRSQTHLCHSRRKLCLRSGGVKRLSDLRLLLAALRLKCL
jgi:hypothetical protein